MRLPINISSWLWKLAVAVGTLSAATSAFSQATPIRSVSTLPATCTGGIPFAHTDEVVLITVGVGTLYICSAPNTWTQAGNAILLETNGGANGSQSILNLIQGANITLTDNGTGGITITGTGGGGGGGTPSLPLTSVQYNNGGSCGGMQHTNATSKVTYTNTTGLVNLPNLNNIRYVTPDFNYLQTDVAGSIGNLSVAGVNTLTLTPCPKGIAGSDTNLYVYVAGVGTAEPARVTTSGGAGTCTSGAASGTVKVTTVNIHGAGFTVGSASGGIYEALKDATQANANNVHLILEPTNPPGSVFYSVYAPILLTNDALEIDGGYSATIDCNAKTACFKTTASGIVHLHSFRVATHVGYAGVAITNTACAANVSTITSTLNPDVGESVDIQQTFNHHYWGVHTVATTSASSWTYADTNCGGVTTIASQATAGGNAYLNAFAMMGFGSSGAGSEVDHILLDAPGGFLASTVNNLVVIGNDQGFHVHHISIATPLANCTVNYCANLIYAPGPFGTNAAVINIDHLEASLFCNSNGITAYNGNTVAIYDSVIQGFAEWAISGGVSQGGFGGFEFNNIYNEVGACSNPNYPGSGLQVRAEAGLFLQGSGASATGGEFPIGNMPKFAATGNGARQYNYFAVIHDSVLGTSVPLNCGYATVDSVTPTGSITVACPRVQGTNTITYDILRTTGSGSTTVYPYNGGCTGGSTTACGSVLTAQAQCSTIICSFTDTASASTSSYAVANANYFPFLNFWPGGAVLGPAVDTTNIASGGGTFSGGGAVTNVSPLITTRTGIPSAAGICGLNNGGNWISCTEGTSSGNSNTGVIGMLLQNGPATGGGVANFKGRLNFINPPGSSLNVGHIITLVDSNAVKTIANSIMRPSNDANDTYIGLDNGSVSVGSAQLSIGAPVSISEYIANIGDGTSWKERLTTSLKSFTVPMTTNSQITSTLATGTAPFVVASTTNVANLNSATLNGNTFPAPGPIGGTTPAAATFTTLTATSGTFTGTTGIQTGTASNTDLAGTLTLSTGTQTYNFAGTYVSAPICVASDTTATNAVRVQTSTTVLTLTGTGSDVIYYICVGRN